MNFILGIISSMLAGFSSVKTKEAIEHVDLSEFQKTNSLVNLMIALPAYLVISRSSLIASSERHITLTGVIILAVYLALRIVSNTAQNKIMKYKDIDVGLVTVILSSGCFLSLAMSGAQASISIVGPIVLAVIGVCISILNFKERKIQMPGSVIVLLILAYIASGTKPYMGNVLMNSFTIGDLVIAEYLNYAIMYAIVYRKSKMTIPTVKKVIPLSILSVIIMTLTYNVYKDVPVYIITSFVSTISTVVLSRIILKRKATRQVYWGIAVIAIAVVLFKLYN